MCLLVNGLCAFLSCSEFENDTDRKIAKTGASRVSLLFPVSDAQNCTLLLWSPTFAILMSNSLATRIKFLADKWFLVANKHHAIVPNLNMNLAPICNLIPASYRAENMAGGLGQCVGLYCAAPSGLTLSRGGALTHETHLRIRYELKHVAFQRRIPT